MKRIVVYLRKIIVPKSQFNTIHKQEEQMFKIELINFTNVNIKSVNINQPKQKPF